jgi:hypothetical protein
MLIALTKVVWRTLLYQQIDPYPLAYDLENPVTVNSFMTLKSCIISRDFERTISHEFEVVYYL